MSIKKHLPTITIFTIIIGIIALGIYFSERDSTINKELAKLDVYSEEELSFLEEQGFLNDIDSENLPDNKEQIVSLLKSPNLIEQNLNSPDESFEVLATKLDESTYQLAFKLENKSNQDKEFYLIPISESSQTEFKEIKGVVKGGKVSWGNQGDWGYDIEKHKQELRPELAKAYDDIEKNGYTGKPIKLVLEANSTLLAQSKWEISRGPTSGNLEPIYLLVYGSAGGVKDELTILTVHSSPQQGENWEVEFTTRGIADLRIIPNDQATIDDDEFIGLYCNDEKRIPQILPGDIIFYPDWECLSAEALAKEGNGIGKVIHYTKKAGKHALKFQFGKQEAFAYNSPDLIDNLISYWKLDDNAANTNVEDIHSTNEGTFNDAGGDPNTDAHTIAGQINTALDFDGGDDRVDIGSDYRPVKEMSFATWFKVDVMPNSGGTNLDGLGEDTVLGEHNNGWGLILYQDDIRFWVNSWNTNFAEVGSFTDTTSWHFVVGVYDGTNIYVYLDNVLGSTTDTHSSNINYGASTGLQFGQGYTGNDNWFDGTIDEVAIWNRALTQTEITALYNSGAGWTYPFNTSTIGLKGSILKIKGAKLKIK